MAEVRPFRGTRYNPEAIGDLSLVVAPPYDVISDAGRDAYYNKHPYNVIRLIMNRPKKTDSDPEQPYRRVAEFIDRWTAQRILIQDPAPGIYLYRQRYLLEGQYKECTGVVARVRVEEFSEGGILPHEEIMPKPFADRMKLLAHARINLDLVHALYSDPAERLKEPILAEMERFPLAQFQTEDGVAHDVWAVSEPKSVKKMTSFFGGKPLYIADGHHRYQTAQEYSRTLRERGEITSEDDPRNFLMMMIVEMENPGLTVLPVHRVVLWRDLDLERFMGRLSRWFALEEVEVPRGARSGQVFHLLKLLEERSENMVFGVFLPDDRFILMSFRQDLDVEREVEGDFSAPCKNLDVTVLQKLVFEGSLGIASDRESVENTLVLTRDPLEAVRMVDSGAGSMVFFVNPTRVEQVRQVADQGEKMPQKSTYFYPKPFSGVVMNRITEW